jgi:hypothetical protein
LSDRSDFAVGIGTSLTRFAGDSAYQALRKLTYFGPMGSVSVATSVGNARIALGISDIMYAIQYERPIDGKTSFMQHDLLITAGLRIGL